MLFSKNVSQNGYFNNVLLMKYFKWENDNIYSVSYSYLGVFLIFGNLT